MNELLAPLYWLCRGDVSGGGDAHAEADSWHLFVALISDFRDHFCKQLDNTQAGIKATLGRLSAMLKLHDRELWYHLSVKNKVTHRRMAPPVPHLHVISPRMAGEQELQSCQKRCLL